MQDIDTPSFAGQESEAPITKTSSLLSAIHTHTKTVLMPTLAANSLSLNTFAQQYFQQLDSYLQQTGYVFIISLFVC